MMLLTEVIFVANVATANHGKFPLASDFFLRQQGKIYPFLCSLHIYDDNDIIRLNLARTMSHWGTSNIPSLSKSWTPKAAWKTLVLVPLQIYAELKVKMDLTYWWRRKKMTDIVVGSILGGRTRGREIWFFWRLLTIVIRPKYSRSIKYWCKRSDLLN